MSAISTHDVTVELLPADPEQYELIRNLYQFYAYESSDWEQEDVEADGRFYVCDEHLSRYWDEQDWSANVLLVDGFVAGFVLIERSELPGIEALELADMFILKKYRRLGIGRALASEVLMSPEHAWLVRYYAQDEVAAAFWRSVLDTIARPVKPLELNDDPELLNFMLPRALH